MSPSAWMTSWPSWHALRAAGATLVDEVPREGLYGPVAFVHPETMGGVLVELVGRQGPGR